MISQTTKNLKVGNGDGIFQLPFNEDKDKEKRAKQYWDLWQKYREHKEQTITLLNKNGVKRNIYDYIEDSVKRMNEYHLKPDHKEAWQNNVFDPITRDKLIFILGQLAASRMKPELIIESDNIFSSPGIERKKSVYKDLLEAANRKNREQSQIVWEMYTCLAEGTVVGFESWQKFSRDIEFVTEINPETGEKKTKKIKVDEWDDVFGEIVPFENFFPESIWVNHEEFYRKVRRCFTVEEMTEASFKDVYGKFPGADKVKASGHYRDQKVFEWGISNDVHQDHIEIRKYYDAIADRLMIWGNSIELYNGCLPWNHKQLPFWIGIAEPLHQQFLFGKSLPDKLMGMQDVNNAVFNAMLDQLYIALNSPIFVDGEIEDFDEGYLEPSRVYQIAPGSKVEQVSLGNVTSASFAMLNLIKKSMEESSVSAQAQGVPSGGRKTKFEVQQLQEGALKLAGLFLQMMESAMERKYWLRMHNILQYYSMPSRKKSGKKKFKFITLEDTRLSNGKRGKRMIQLVNGKEDVPGQREMEMIAEAEEGKPFNPVESKVEPVFITREYLINDELSLEIRIVPNSSVKQSEAEKKNMDLAFYQATSQDPNFDQEMNRKDFARAFGKPEEIVVKNVQQPEQQPAMAGQKPQQKPANINLDML